MITKIASIGLLTLLVLLTAGCVRVTQPAQYGTQVIRTVKVLGSKLSIPSTTEGGSALEFFFGYVNMTTMIIPVVSNVNTNGEVSQHSVSISAAPLITMFGVSDIPGIGGVKVTDTVMSGIVVTNYNTLPLYQLTPKLRPQ